MCQPAVAVAVADGDDVFAVHSFLTRHSDNGTARQVEKAG
jgi:hypothetical protein